VPFHSERLEDLWVLISDKNSNYAPLPDWLDPEFAKIIDLMLIKDPSKRPSIWFIA
jgi:hypothetical protein